jgi:hypothetical protein
VHIAFTSDANAICGVHIAFTSDANATVQRAHRVHERCAYFFPPCPGPRISLIFAAASNV